MQYHERSKVRLKEHKKDGEISNRRLVPATTDVTQLLGSGFQPIYVDVGKSLPLGIVDIEVVDEAARVAGEKRPL